MKIENMLGDEIQNEFEKLKGDALGSEQYSKTVDGLTKMVDRAIEIEKLKLEAANKEKQLKEERKDRIVKNIISAAGVIIPVGVTIWGTLVSFKFEEEGSVTTIMGRGFVNKLLPKK